MASLLDELNTSALFCSLFGTKRTFEKQLQLTDVYYILHNNKKAALTLNTRKDPTKPYAFFSIGSLQIVKDTFNVKALRRHGITHSSNDFAGVTGATNATMNNFHMFPTSIACEFHYYNNDIKSLTKFVEAFLILAVTDCFNFIVKINEEAHWTSRIEVSDDTITIPEIEYDSAENPSTFEIVVPFTIHTHIGFLRSVARVNSDHPTVTFNLNTNQQETESVP
jgi:hypothetical protein